jgi:hypothetical protein
MNTETIQAPDNILAANRRRNGRVARLPKELRDRVNSLLDDGVTYADIAEQINKAGKLTAPLSTDSIGTWKQGGYQDYLRAQDWRDRMTIMCDKFLDPAQSDPIQLAAGALHTAMIQVCDCMDQIALAKSGQTDPKNFTNIANTLSRISRSIVIISEYRDQLAELKAADPSTKEAQAKARAEMLDKMDQLFGIRPVKAIDRIFGPIPGTEPASQTSHPCESVPVSDRPCNNKPHSGLFSSLSSAGGEGRREEAVSSSEIKQQPI